MSSNSYHRTQQFLPTDMSKGIKTYIHTKTGTRMSTALFITAKKKRKQPKCASIHKWMNKMWWYIHTNEYLSIKGIKNQYTLIQVKLENIPRERSQSQKATDCILFIQKVWNRQINRNRKYSSNSCQTLGKRD